MEFTYYRNPSLPPMGWCAMLSEGSETVSVEHGSMVETRAEFFVEGAWNGAFSDGRFDESEVFFGSGARLLSDHVVFCPTSHSMERLHSLHLGDKLYVSNSFPFILTASSQQLDYAEWRYETWFMSFLHGIDRARREIPVLGATVRLHYCNNIKVDSSLNLSEHNRDTPPNFPDYQSYIGFVKQAIADIATNARSNERDSHYTPMTTVSSGYDSGACAVLAQEVGCTEAITVTDARPDHGIEKDDSGSGIASVLKLQVTAYERSGLRHMRGFPEADFLVTGNGGDDVVFSLFESQLTSKLLFTGFLGDTLWGTSGSNPSRSEQFQYTYPPGGTLGEFRLRTGFIHLPVPLMTFTRHPAVHAITLSDEMAPWRIGGDYDRPIPRRILEERGVVRGTFASSKKAITVPYWTVKKPQDFLSEISGRDLLDYVRMRAKSDPPNLPSRARKTRDRIIEYALSRTHSQSTAWRVIKALRLLSLDFKSAGQVWAGYARAENSLKFHWALDKALPRYATSILAAGRVNPGR